MRRKTLIILSVFLVFLSSNLILKGSSIGLRSKVAFQIDIKAGSGLGIQMTGSDSYALFTVISGNLTSSRTSLNIGRNRGWLTFYSDNATTLRGTRSNIHVAYRINNLEEVIWENLTDISLVKDDFIRIRFFVRSLVDQYFTIALGLGGLFLCIGSPAWSIALLKTKGFEGLERVGLLSVLTLIGFALVIMWLW